MADYKMKVLVLAGGFGTRLKVAVPDLPKALAPVKDVTFLHLQLEQWVSQGLREFIFLLHSQAALIADFLRVVRPGFHKDCRFDWIIESAPLGTGGAIAHAVEELKLCDNFLVTNADTWLGAGALKLLRANSPSIAVVRVPDASRYGQVIIDNANVVTAFTQTNGGHSPNWINAGFYHLSPSLFHDWSGDPFSLERQLFTELVKNRRLTAVPLQTDFIDIGVPNDYHRFCRWIEGGRQTSL